MPGLTEAFEAICTQRNYRPWFCNQLFKDTSIRRINHYALDNSIGFNSTYIQWFSHWITPSDSLNNWGQTFNFWQRQITWLGRFSFAKDSNLGLILITLWLNPVLQYSMIWHQIGCPVLLIKAVCEFSCSIISLSLTSFSFLNASFTEKVKFANHRYQCMYWSILRRFTE